jgi:quercetin dioxygenase-like cupin family protein
MGAGETHDSDSERKVLNLRSVFGLEATITTPAVATDGAYVELDVMLEPGGGTNAHIHP